ncbi:MAG: hypothetical protein QW279_04435 [Candidatus Jordarchaeaceae archaeon]
MKFTWGTTWKDEEISVEAATLKEFEAALAELGVMSRSDDQSTEKETSYPEISSILGCTDAVRTFLEKDWEKQPRSMNEINKALEANQLYPSKGALSATLVTLAKKGDIRRVKEERNWKYFFKINSSISNSNRQS